MANSPDKAAVHMAQLLALLAARDFEGAERLAREGLEKYPASRGFHLALGDIYSARGEEAEALYEYQWELLSAGEDRPTGSAAARRSAELMQKTNPDPEVCRVISAMKTMRNDAREARREFAELVKSRGDRFVLLLYLAESTQMAGDVDGAITIYRKLIQRDPYFVPAYVQLSELLEKSGTTDRAKELMDKAWSIDPEHWRLKS
jgi:tetratricopeptide (TPR) repeat protein